MKLNVLLVSDQVRGIDGTGGLGDVATGLAKELATRDDTEIRIVMPGYQKISEKGLDDRFDDVVFEDLRVPFGDRTVSIRVCRYHLPKFVATEPHVTCYLLCEPQWFRERENSGPQAVLLARATLAFVERFAEFRPDLIHGNDWHTGLIPVALDALYSADPHLGRIATLYTTHNNSYAVYQGATAFANVQHLTGLSDQCYRPGATRSLEHYGAFNFAKGGLGFADLVNTVSLTYAAELRSRAFGGRMEAVLESRAQDLCGIVNGIDLHEWDPAKDTSVPADCRFSSDQPIEKIRKRKRKIREQLRQWLPEKSDTAPFAKVGDDTILIAAVTRITNQKMPVMLPLREDTGWDVEMMSPLEKICRDRSDVQIIFLGSPERGDDLGRRYVERLGQLQQMLPGQILFYNGYDSRLSHLMYAAAEMCLVPSVFEPCGLTQLIGMRYGTVPIVRGVGGLQDTVVDEAESFAANGFKFLERKEPVAQWEQMADVPAAAELLYQTLRRAIAVRQNEPRWSELIRNGMVRDSGWSIPAAQYRRLYEAAVQTRTAASFAVPRSLSQVQRRLEAATSRLELLLTMSPPMFENLGKFATGSFGPYELTEAFRAELLQFREAGHVSLEPLERIPYRGDNLSNYVQITDAGREFLRLRAAIRAALA